MQSQTRNLTLAGVALAAAATVTTFVLTSSNVTRVAPGEDLQAAINTAQCGSIIELDAGAAYPANLTLPNKNCSEFITIQSSRIAELPEGNRIDPVTQAPLFATLESTVNAEPVIKTATAAHHYKLLGLRAKTRDGSVFVYDLIRFGDSRQSQTALDQVPHHIIWDRGWIEGNPDQQTQRGVALNCADCGITNSVVSNIKAKGMDTQAVAGWNGTLRAFVLNNDLYATGEVIMWGGSDPATTAWDANGIPIDGLIPRNAEMRRNHIWKPMEWKGQGYTIKNLVELKNCIGCTLDGNLIENNWGGEGQSGPCLLATVRNQEGSAPYSIIENYVVTNNFVRNCEGALNLQGLDNEKPSAQSKGALIKNNVFDQPGTFLLIHGFDDVTVENNTHLQSCPADWTCNTILFYGNHQSHAFVYRWNVTQEKQYGIRDETGVSGVDALAKWAPSYVLVENVIATPYTKNPPGNDYPPSLTITSDYRTPYTGKGADIDALLAAQSGGATSRPSPTASATASVTVSPSPTPSSSPVVGIPVGSNVGIISPANVRAKPEQSSQELFIAQVTDQGTTTGDCIKDTASVNVYCPVTFSTRSGASGFVAIQFLKTITVPSPSPTSTPTAVPTSTPSPSPIATATPSPQPSPSSSPTVAPLPFCASGTRPGTPPKCRCRNGFQGSSGKCR